MPESRVRLPSHVRAPFEVYLEGVRQVEGQDYTVEGKELRFPREVPQEGRLGFWRWTLGAIGIGTYRPHETVDVRYTTADGRPMVAHALPVEPLGE